MKADIKQLAKQAGLNTDYIDYIDYFGPKLLEQFAKVIAEECAKQLCDPKFRASFDESKMMVGQNLILNHFGVE